MLSNSATGVAADASALLLDITYVEDGLFLVEWEQGGIPHTSEVQAKYVRESYVRSVLEVEDVTTGGTPALSSRLLDDVLEAAVRRAKHNGGSL